MVALPSARPVSRSVSRSLPPKAGFFCRCLWPRRCRTEWDGRGAPPAVKLKDLALAPGRLVDYSSPVAEKDAALWLNLATAGSFRPPGPHPTPRHGARADPYACIFKCRKRIAGHVVCRCVEWHMSPPDQGVGDWLDSSPFWDDDVVPWQRLFTTTCIFPFSFFSSNAAVSLHGAEKTERCVAR